MGAAVTLFSPGERTRTTSRRYNEPLYRFVDTSAWPSVARVRQFWEDWFQQYDENRKPGLAARFRSSDNHPHLSAFVELFTFAVLKRAGYELEIEPPAGRGTLEYVASMNQPDRRFYAECTATGQRAAELGADAREADVLDAIDKVATGPFLLQVEVRQRGAQAPSIKRLRGELRTWLSTLDHQHAAAQFRDTNRLDQWTWTARGWSITFSALPGEVEPDDDDGALGMIGPRYLDTDQHLRLRQALDAKAGKYGRLGDPLLVVANSTQHQRDRDLMKALLGDVVWDINLPSNHFSERYLLNGVLGSPAKPRNTVLSAVMHGRFGELTFADAPMLLVHHPFSSHPLPLDLFPFAEERHFDRESGNFLTASPTMTVGEFFSLPSGWPFFDQDPR